MHEGSLCQQHKAKAHCTASAQRWTSANPSFFSWVHTTLVPAAVAEGCSTSKAAPSPQKSSQPCCAQAGCGWYPRWAGSSDQSDVLGSSLPASVKQDQVFCHLATCFINTNLYLSLLLFFQGLFMVQSCRQYRSFLQSPPPSYLWQSVSLERSNLREEIHWRWK